MKTRTPATLFRNLLVGTGIACCVLTSAATAAAQEQGDPDVENFSYSDWDLNYHLSLDAEERAQAEVSETLVAQFPEYDQNRGIVRSLPLRFEGAPAAPEDISITDGSGSAVPFEVEDDGGVRTILVGDDSVVHGDQTYEITYTLSDVIRADDEIDEFYWDLVPDDRLQSIESVTAEITFDEQLSSALTGEHACYLGTPGATGGCELANDEAASTAFTLGPVELPASEALTIAIGMDSGTVLQPAERQENFLLDVVPPTLGALALLPAAGGALMVMRAHRRHSDTVSVSPVPTTTIPEGVNPLLAAPLLGNAHQPVVASILDLAVRGATRIEEDPDHVPRWYNKTAPPVLRLIDPEIATDPLEKQLLEGMFPGLAEGDTFSFPENDKTFTKAAQKVVQGSRQATLDRGLQKRLWQRGPALFGFGAMLTYLIAASLLISGASRDNTATLVTTLSLGVIVLVLALICTLPQRVPTSKGAELKQQLEQLRELITASEADRLEMIHSPANAERVPTGEQTHQSTQVLRLYDRLLPYAILFGKHKQWGSVLAVSYAQGHRTAPYWNPSMFNSGNQGLESSLSSMISSVSTAASSASSGGGAAGGGGGGGSAGGR